MELATASNEPLPTRSPLSQLSSMKRMIVPTVGVVVGDDDGGVAPVLGLRQEVDGVDDESLFIKRIGVAGVTVLIAGGLQEADGREVAGIDGVEEIVGVVLVIAGIALLSDGGHRRWTGVVQVLGGDVVLERLMVRDVIGLGLSSDRRRVRALAAGAAVGVGDGQVEAAFEEAPADARGIQHIADVAAAHLQNFAAGGGAGVADRVGIADQREAAVTVSDDSAAAVLVRDDTVGLTGNQVQRAIGRGTKVGVVGVIAHGEVLSVVPQGGNGVAVVIPHGQTGRVNDTAAARRRARDTNVGREQIHQAFIEGQLLRRVIVVLVVGSRLRAVEAE